MDKNPENVFVLCMWWHANRNRKNLRGNRGNLIKCFKLTKFCPTKFSVCLHLIICEGKNSDVNVWFETANL